jgi:hypothetical protein
MTGPDDQSNTRPISVAELLARNGTIGAPPVGGRRRRRRGNADAVTVAELTGEIPIVTDATPPPSAAPEPEPESQPAEEADLTDEAAVADEPEATDEPAVADASTNGTGDAQTLTVGATDEATVEPLPVSDAEEMSPDPLIEDGPELVDLSEDGTEIPEADTDLDTDAETADVQTADALDAELDADALHVDPPVEDDLHDDIDGEDDDDAAGQLPSYLRSSDDSLFGGPTGPSGSGGSSVDDETTRRIDTAGADRRGAGTSAEPAGARDTAAAGSPLSAVTRGAWIVGQCIVAVAFGAGLFIAFDRLWEWNSLVALVLGVLVILGLVVGVRVVRKTEDIGSTLIAVVVGALVTFGPLALLSAR